MRNKLGEKVKALQARWETLTTGLHGLSPLNILKKGYTLCWKEKESRLLRFPEEAAKGEKVVVSFIKGELTCEVKDVDAERTVESRLAKERS